MSDLNKYNNQEKQILEIIKQEIRSVESNDLDMYLSILTGETIFYPPGGEAKTGKELKQFLGDFIKNFDVKWISFDHNEIIIKENFAYHLYSYEWEVSPKEGNETINSSGSGIHILHNSLEDGWTIYREIWN